MKCFVVSQDWVYISIMNYVYLLSENKCMLTIQREFVYKLTRVESIDLVKCFSLIELELTILF